MTPEDLNREMLATIEKSREILSGSRSTRCSFHMRGANQGESKPDRVPVKEIKANSGIQALKKKMFVRKLEFKDV